MSESKVVTPDDAVEADNGGMSAPDDFNLVANIVTWAAWGEGTAEEAATRILEALTPRLKAEAWDEGYDAADYDAPHSIKTPNPYGPAK